MVDIILRIPQGKAAAVKTWLESKGIEYGKDEDGITLTKGHQILGVVNSRIRKAANGDKYFASKFEDKIAAKLPVKPNYLIWRSDELDEEGQLLPWPTFQIDDSENPGSFITKTVGGIA